MELLCVGCSGFVGSAVRKQLLASGHTLYVVSRKLPQQQKSQESWVRYESDWMSYLSRVDGIVNFAGEPIISGLWSPAQRRLIEESRAGLCRRIVDRLGHQDRIPKIWINASAVGFYGDRGEEVLTENSEGGKGFLAQVCQDWEAEVRRSETLGVREVRLRLGTVLDPAGGILARLLPLYRMGLGGKWGKGTQYFPWVSLEDVAQVVNFCLQYPIRGAVNVVAPNAIRQSEFSSQLADFCGRTAWVDLPSWFLKLLPGPMSELFLFSQRVRAEQLDKLHFQFRKAEWKQILADLS